MKPIYAHAAAALGLTFTIAACVPAPSSTPPPEAVEAQTPLPAPIATPTPAPVQPTFEPVGEDWADQPRSAGSWTYSNELGTPNAQFKNANGETLFTVVCHQGDERIELVREGDRLTDRIIAIRTETADRTLSGRAAYGGRALGAGVSMRDPLLDAMALTRGRFAVDVPGLEPLFLPAWAEVTRVIEDCR